MLTLLHTPPHSSFDKFFVSDEELIEGAKFLLPFSSMCDAMRVLPPNPFEQMEKDALSKIPLSERMLIRQVREHHYHVRRHSELSPTIIIQRIFRGFTVRSWTNEFRARAPGAAVTIQRHARGYLYRKSIYDELSALLREVAPRLVYSWEEKQEIKAAVVIQTFWRDYYAGVMRIKGAKM